MITLTKEQLADLLRDAYEQGAIDSQLCGPMWLSSEAYHDRCERAIQPLVHRSSGGQAEPSIILPTPEQVMHVVMKFQWEDRKNGTGTTNWAANLGMTVVEYVARLNADHGREVE